MGSIFKEQKPPVASGSGGGYLVTAWVGQWPGGDPQDLWGSGRTLLLDLGAVSTGFALWKVIKFHM